MKIAEIRGPGPDQAVWDPDGWLAKNEKASEATGKNVGERFREAEALAKKLDRLLLVTSGWFRSAVSVRHEDGSTFLFRYAFAVRAGYEEEFLVVFTEHVGTHVFHVSDLEDFTEMELPAKPRKRGERTLEGVDPKIRKEWQRYTKSREGRASEVYRQAFQKPDGEERDALIRKAERILHMKGRRRKTTPKRKQASR
jgi:hypothetical protein